jgi:hypothetical protein
MRSSMARAAPLAICVAVICTAAPARGAEPKPSPAKIEEAKRHMKAGASFYNDPSGHKCEEAIREFGKAYELSGSLNALKGMAICNLELERDGDAIEQYTAYLTGKGNAIDAAEKAQIEADLNALKQAAAAVSLSADKEGVKVTDVRTPSRGYPIQNTYTLSAGKKKLGIHPGQHLFTASVEGKPDLTWKVEIANGGTYEHAFEFRKDAPPPPKTEPPPPAPVKMIRPVPAAVWVTTGLTVALAGTWVGLAVRAKGKNSDYNKVNGKEPATQLEALRSDVKSANLIADIFMGATIASLGTTVILYFTRPSKPEPAPKSSFGPPESGPRQTGRWTLAPAASSSGGGAQLVGSF